ncbi:MAG TPA: GtrA family protein [Bacillota bacterium]|nr:GtrA family protein [Bacillota bacterium]HPF42918.1 GtrA family protein [Bacillota bacterium]HPJ86393.1 GtrA family protein [Bacillota bacterium]HPQ62420.1 GtrA family protein [Bacillota bacterium]HRX92162.1 GtrA family protein [Candidatus Izemoplasmatales bacterium]
MTDKRKKELWRAFKFLLFSASAGLIEFGSFTLLNEVKWFDFLDRLSSFQYLGTEYTWHYAFCYLIALILSVLWNFTFNRRFTFKSANNINIAMLKVFVFYLFFTPASTLITYLLADQMGLNEYVVLIIVMISNLLLEFPYQRFFVFGKSLDTNAAAIKALENQETSISEN